MMFSPFTVAVLSMISVGIALFLSVIAVIGTGDKDSLQKYSTIQLNTSIILQHAVKLRTSSTINQRALPTSFTPTPLAADAAFISVNPNTIIHANPIEDGINEASALFNSIVQPMATAIGTGIIPSPTNVISDFENLFKQMLGQLSNTIDNGVDNAVQLIIKEVLEVLGIKQWYGLYFGKFCSADYKPNYQDPKATLTGMKCQGIRDPLKNPPSENHLNVGATTLDFSALNIPEKVTTISNQLTHGFRFLFGLELLGMISSGLTLLSLPLLFISQFRIPPAQIGLWSLATFSALCFFLMAVIQTTVAIVAGGMANQLGFGLGLSARLGSAQLALFWASAVLMIFAASVLFIHWFDEIYIRRSRVHVYQKPEAEPMVEPKWSTDR